MQVGRLDRDLQARTAGATGNSNSRRLQAEAVKYYANTEMQCTCTAL